MIEPRIYRAAFLPAVLAIVLVAFSLQPPPPPLGQGLAADALFDGTGATAQLQQILQTAVDRRPGTRGDAAVAAETQHAFEQAGFPTTLDRFSEGGANLENVVARKPGDTPREIVVIAGRDAPAVPDAASSAADTAALIEYANVFQGSAAHHTMVLASVDGQTLGDAGARRLVGTLDPSQVDAVIVLSNLAANRSAGPLTELWSNGPNRGSIGLERTANDSLRFELGSVPHSESWVSQFARLAFPIAPGAQAAFLDSGFNAIGISGSGTLRPPHEDAAHIDTDRYGAIGRGTLRLVSAVDSSANAPAHGPASYLEVNGQVLPDWAVTLLALTLMLPALVTSVDALARTRRRHQQSALWFAWVAIAAVPFAIAYIAGKLFVLIGLGPYAPPSPLDPATITLSAGVICSVVLTAGAAALAWFLLRPLLVGLAGGIDDPASPGAAAATALVLSAIGFAMAFVNPYAALVLVPATHLWLLALLTDTGRKRASIIALAGLLPVLLLALFWLVRFDLNPLRGADYLLLLVLGGQPGTGGTVLLCLLLGVAASVGSVIWSRSRAREPAGPPPPPAAPVFGPRGYAGLGAPTARR